MEETESKTIYWIEFNIKINLIEEEINKNYNEINLNEIKNNLNNLQIYATSNTEILPKYDIRRSQEVFTSLLLDFLHFSLFLILFNKQEIEILKKKIQILEEKVKPRKKFTFSSRSNNQTPKR